MKTTWKSKKLKKILKNTGLTLYTVSLAGFISVGSYNLYLNSKLDDIKISQENVQIIEEYYDNLNQDPVVFVMNDSQGKNLNIGFWKNSYPEYLSEELNATLVDASSLRFNKASHIDMLLENNLSIEELKQLNNQGAYEAIRKIATDINLPLLKNLFGNIGSIVFGQKIQDIDKSMYISDLLGNSKEPIVIYSSGANDLMFLASANPSSLKKYDSNGEITDKYLYAEDILNNPSTISNVIASIEQNLCNILSINPNAKIFVLSIYVPKALEGQDYEIFSKAIEEFNNKLMLLCEKYNACFVDETDLGKIYNQSKSNFHISEIGHKELASLLIDEISDNIGQTDPSANDFNNHKYQTKGLEGYYKDLVEEISYITFSCEGETDIALYLNDVYLKQLKEKVEDAEICKKLIKK